MAYSNEELAVLAAAFQGLPTDVKAIFNAKSTQDTSAAIASLITQQRGQSMSQAVGSMVTLQVASWSGLTAAAQVADGATLQESLVATKAALVANDASQLGAHAVAACLAALKHFGI